MRSLARFLGLLALLPVSWIGCAGCESPPPGWGSATWGSDPAQANASATGWEASWVEGGFEVSSPIEVEAYGHRADLRLIRSGTELQGYELTFAGVDASAIRPQVVAEFDLEGAGDPLYQVWSDGEAVHLEGGDWGCLLVVAGPAFGRQYQAALLRSGLMHLESGFMPH